MHASWFAPVLALACCLAVPARADTFAFGGSGGSAQSLSLTFSNGQSSTLSTNLVQGFVTDDQGGRAGPDGNSSYFVGTFGGISANDFFVFGLNGLSGTVTGASLMLTSFNTSGTPTYTLFDVSTPASTLFDVVSPNPAVFTDLASGRSYGSFSVSPTATAVNSFGLNAAGLADLNLAIASGSGNFAIGGTLSPIASNAVVPEPASLALLGAGLAGLAMTRRRRAA